jgi:hypothetical protein
MATYTPINHPPVPIGDYGKYYTSLQRESPEHLDGTRNVKFQATTADSQGQVQEVEGVFTLLHIYPTPAFIGRYSKKGTAPRIRVMACSGNGHFQSNYYPLQAQS